MTGAVDERSIDGQRETGMESDVQAQVKRIDELERRVEHLENHLVTRDVLDDEIRSLERRLREVRELTEG